MRLLLAAGKTDLRLSLELLFSELPGVEVVGSASETGGLMALIKTSEPDMVLTDWDLPVWPLATILSKRERSYHLPKMIVLAASNSECRAAKEAGADAAVLRGSSPDLLLSAFQELRTQKTANQEVK